MITILYQKKNHCDKIAEKRIDPLPTDHKLKDLFKPENQKFDECPELIVKPEEISIHEIANKWICPHPRDNSATPCDPGKQKTEERSESKDISEEKHVHEISCKWISLPPNNSKIMPKQNELDKCGEAQDNLEQFPHKILHETSFPILKDVKTTSLEFTE